MDRKPAGLLTPFPPPRSWEDLEIRGPRLGHGKTEGKRRQHELDSCPRRKPTSPATPGNHSGVGLSRAGSLVRALLTTGFPTWASHCWLRPVAAVVLESPAASSFSGLCFCPGCWLLSLLREEVCSWKRSEGVTSPQGAQVPKMWLLTLLTGYYWSV